MNKDDVRNFVKTVDNHLFDIVNNLICSVCQEILNKPVTTPCGHCFCNGCIRRVLSTKDNNGCPLCKTPVKRYGLEMDKVKSTLSEICQELPEAFKKDVENLCKDSRERAEDLIKISKLSQLYSQECSKEVKTTRRKSSRGKSKPEPKLKATENDSSTFVPVLKRSKNVIEYASAKKKKMDELVSVSQTEVASNSSVCDSTELNKKLKKMEKMEPEEKVKEWFDAVGDNIYLNSPTPSLSSEVENRPKTSSMIRRDYVKTGSSSHTRENSANNDPYEFIPSQKTYALKKQRQKKSIVKRKKIPEFRAIQSFTRESIKRNFIINQEEPEVEEISLDEPKEQNLVTASQKFEKLLLETKEKDKETPSSTVHTLYIASQSSSPKFLDCSFHSKVEKTDRKSTSGTAKKKLSDNSAFELFKDCTETGNISRSKRRRSSEARKTGDKRKKLMKENSRLLDLLKELADDEVIYFQSKNSPVRLQIAEEDKRTTTSPGAITQNTHLIGFCTQEELPEEKKFKEMVANMEEELNSEQNEISEGSELSILCRSDIKVPKDNREKNKVSETSLQLELSTDVKTTKEDGQKEQTIESLDLVPFNLLGKIKKTKVSFVDFLRLGRLTPKVKRAKSSVVKLVFPVGLSSLRRKRTESVRSSTTLSGIQTLHAKPSVEIQTSQQMTSTTGIQTSQEIRKSTEIQTSQVPFSSAEVQTTQIERSVTGNQTTQVMKTTAENQTSQFWLEEPMMEKVTTGNQTSQVEVEKITIGTSPWKPTQNNNKSPSVIDIFSSDSKIDTPLSRRPSVKHRKIIKRGNSEEELKCVPSPIEILSPGLSEDKETSQQESLKSLIIDFDLEKEFAKTWAKNTQKNHESFVEMKNRKNKLEARRKLEEEFSDDSDIQPLKKSRNLYRIISQESSSPEVKHRIPLDVTKGTAHKDCEDIDLKAKPSEETQEQQMQRVLRNIDMDLKKSRKEENNPPKGERDEESDSDFFVEQTPPKSKMTDSRSKDNTKAATQEKESEDLIADSIPKAMFETESFLMLSAPEKVLLTPKKSLEPPDIGKKTPKRSVKPLTSFDLPKPNENDQNQLNADLTKSAEPKSSQRKSGKRICVISSSVKNPEVIKKFVSKFKLEYSNKLSKDITHLIVGLHENDENEMLPLCTPKLLYAIANKKWVVSETWAETCLKMNEILPEENFETLDPIGGEGCKTARLSTQPLLANCEVCLMGNFQTISKEELADLVVDCGGSLISSPEQFSYLPSRIRMIIADRDCLEMSEKQLKELYEEYSTAVLSRDVIIMSIQSYKVANFTPYLLHPASEEDLLKKGYPWELAKNEDDPDEDDEE